MDPTWPHAICPSSCVYGRHGSPSIGGLQPPQQGASAANSATVPQAVLAYPPNLTVHRQTGQELYYRSGGWGQVSVVAQQIRPNQYNTARHKGPAQFAQTAAPFQLPLAFQERAIPPSLGLQRPLGSSAPPASSSPILQNLVRSVHEGTPEFGAFAPWERPSHPYPESQHGGSELSQQNGRGLLPQFLGSQVEHNAFAGSNASTITSTVEPPSRFSFHPVDPSRTRRPRTEDQRLKLSRTKMIGSCAYCSFIKKECVYNPGARCKKCLQDRQECVRQCDILLCKVPNFNLDTEDVQTGIKHFEEAWEDARQKSFPKTRGLLSQSLFLEGLRTYQDITLLVQTGIDVRDKSEEIPLDGQELCKLSQELGQIGNEHAVPFDRHLRLDPAQYHVPKFPQDGDIEDSNLLTLSERMAFQVAILDGLVHGRVHVRSGHIKLARSTSLWVSAVTARELVQCAEELSKRTFCQLRKRDRLFETRYSVASYHRVLSALVRLKASNVADAILDDLRTEASRAQGNVVQLFRLTQYFAARKWRRGDSRNHPGSALQHESGVNGRPVSKDPRQMTLDEYLAEVVPPIPTLSPLHLEIFPSQEYLSSILPRHDSISMDEVLHPAGTEKVGVAPFEDARRPDSVPSTAEWTTDLTERNLSTHLSHGPTAESPGVGPTYTAGSIGEMGEASRWTGDTLFPVTSDITATLIGEDAICAEPEHCDELEREGEFLHWWTECDSRGKHPRSQTSSSSGSGFDQRRLKKLALIEPPPESSWLVEE